MSLRIGIMGIAGRMGRLLAEEAVVAGAVVAGGTLRSGTPPAGIPVLRDAAALLGACDVAIDFTHASTASAHAAAAAEAGTPLRARHLRPFAGRGSRGGAAAERVPVVYAANFAPGVNLVLALAERMAAALPPSSYDAEIVEMHHRQKVDAPSGTALALGRAVARGVAPPWRRPASRAGGTAIAARAAPARSASPRCVAARWSASTA